MPSPPRGRRRWWLVGAAVVLLGVIAAVAVVLLHSPGNVSHPSLSFTQPTMTTAPAPAPPPPERKRPVDRFLWARYGYDAARTRFFVGPADLRPPFRVGWRFGGNALIEFPPVIYGHALYFMDDGATVKAINATNGHQIWLTHLGTLSAASCGIALGQRLVICPTLATRGQSPGGGEVAALSMTNGHVVWRHALPSGSESSPIVWKSIVFFGDQAGTVFSMNAATGHINWTYQASGAVKGAVAISNGTAYFGDYAGRAYALNAFTGRQVWAVSTSGTSFGFGSGNFYSTPAVAFGRVYIGSTDGRVYSFAAASGQLAWATGTGAYVYASPSVADVPGLGPTVYMGSYDGRFYAFDARSGAVRWSHAAGGRISGSSTIVNGVVYYSDLGSKTTTGLDARTGRVVFSFPDGAFTPVIADPGALYLSGYDVLYQLLPKNAPSVVPGRRARSRRGRKASRAARRRHPPRGTRKRVRRRGGRRSARRRSPPRRHRGGKRTG